MEDRDKRKEQDGSIFTADGKAVPAEGVEGMMMFLFDEMPEMLDRMGNTALARRLAENLIKSSTEEDIQEFLMFKAAKFMAQERTLTRLCQER